MGEAIVRIWLGNQYWQLPKTVSTFEAQEEEESEAECLRDCMICVETRIGKERSHLASGDFELKYHT